MTDLNESGTAQDGTDSKYIINCLNIKGITQEEISLFQHVVSEARKRKAARFVRETDGIRCICGELLLRYSLYQKYERLSDVELCYNQYGKPYLKDLEQMHFNLSHSGDWVGIAYGIDEVGLDIEKMDIDKTKFGGIDAERNPIFWQAFHDDEQLWLRQYDGDERAKHAIRLWTVKESYLKYIGTGLATDMNSFAILMEQETVIQYKGIQGQPHWKSLMLDQEHYLTICGSDRKIITNIISTEDMKDFALKYQKNT